MANYKHAMHLSIELLYSEELQVGERVAPPSSSQEWDEQTPLQEGDLVEKPGFNGPEWFLLEPKIKRVKRNKYHPQHSAGEWKLGHRD